MRPAFGVAFCAPTPTVEITLRTSGSRRTRSASTFCSRLISANEMVGSADVVAISSPVSCGGRKPFGITT